MRYVLNRQRRQCVICVYLAACWWCVLLRVGYAQYSFDHWTTAQGLPHNNITAITQTRDGYLWLGTTDGLARFDGVRFTVFNTVNAPGFTSNRITRLFVDRRGALWIGTEEGGLMCYAEHRFTAHNEGLPDKFILRIDEDDAGALWVYTQKAIARRAGERFEVLPDTPDTPWHPFYPTRFRQLEPIMAGPWYVDEQGLHRLAQGRVTTVRFPEPTRALNILDCWEDHLGTLWINEAKRGTYRYRNGQLTLVGAFTRLPYTAPCLEDRSGRIWTSVQPDSISRWEAGRRMDYPLPVPPGAPWNANFFQDREGTLWIHSMYHGLFRARPQVITSVAQDHIPSYAMWQDRQQNVWLTHYLKYRAGTFTRYSAVRQRFGEMPGAMYEDHTGDLLFGTGKGLVRLTQDRFVPATSPPGIVLALQRDATGVLWAGGAQGLFRLEPGPLTRFTRQDGLATEEIRVITPRRGGGLWIGGYGGLTEYRDGRFTPVPLLPMPSDRLRSLYEDRDGVLWIGTYDGGLGRWHNGKLTSYTTQNGLYNDGVFQILEDRFGYFWLSCNRGIYRVRKQELNDFAEGRAASIHCTNFNKADGMLNEECNGGRSPAGFVAADGKLWFPTQDGAAVIDPAAVPANEQAPPVVIEACRIDNQAVALRDGLRLEPHQSNLEIQYTGLSLIKSEQMSFRYRLRGLDDNWTEAGARRTAYFAHLPAGAYTLQVVAANSDGVWNNEGATMTITVLAPFYRTWWFGSCATLALFGLVIAGYQYRVRSLERARAAQENFSRRLIESQEHERQRIAAELHDSLGQNLLIIKNRAVLGALKSAPHPPSQEQFTQISDSVSQAIEEVREISYNLRPYHLDRLGLTQTIEAMIERVAAASGIAFTIEVPPLEGLFKAEAEINLYRVLQEAVNNIARHSHATEARVTITRETRQVIVFIQDNGRGITKAEGEANPKSKIQNPKSGGFGLTGMAERIRLLGGTRTIESAPGQGTTVTIKIPLL